jgi:hypothetical protein
MYVPFDLISPSSRIWIYQSARKFTPEEKEMISAHLEAFTQGWAAHGQGLKTSFDIRYNQFIMLAADESHHGASGCSIDSSVRAVKEIEQQLGLDLFDRNQVAFMHENTITLIRLQDLKQKYADGIWNEASLTFNNLVSEKGQLETSWIVPAGNTWLKRYVPASKVAT